MHPYGPSRAPIPDGEVTLGLPRPRPPVGQAGCVFGWWGVRAGAGVRQQRGLCLQSRTKGLSSSSSPGGPRTVWKRSRLRQTAAGLQRSPRELPGATEKPGRDKSWGHSCPEPQCPGAGCWVQASKRVSAQPPSLSLVEKPALGTASPCHEPSSPSFVPYRFSIFDRHRSYPPKGKSWCADRWQNESWGTW